MLICSGCLSRSHGYEICNQTTFSRWQQCKRIQIVNFKRGKTRAKSTWSSCSVCGIRRFCEKDYESGVIVFYAASSFRMCMFQIFARKSARFLLVKAPTRGWQFDSWRGVLLRAELFAAVRFCRNLAIASFRTLFLAKFKSEILKWKRPSDYCCSEEF